MVGEKMRKSNSFNCYQLIIGLISLLLIGCSHQLTPLAAGSTILAFGDSLTAGYGVSRQDSYPEVLAKISGHPVINSGISGETTTQGLARFSQVIDETKPALIILMEGGNDILQNLNPAQTKANLQQMITLAKQKNIQILLVAVPAKSLFSASAGFYKELAQENELPLEDKIIAELEKDPRYKSDYVHFNSQGYKLLAEKIAQDLTKHGALAKP